jgi:7,8-dihydroneopterin aldolase/epimerase/oxygenase
MDTLKIEQLEFYGHCGITPEEQKTGQRFSLDLEMGCDVRRIAQKDELREAFDYAAISRRIIEIAGKEQFRLIETMGERLAQVVLGEFGVKKLTLRLRKIAPPIEPIMAYAAVEIDREA